MATNINTVVSSSASNSQITTQGNDALITKAYADANYSGGGGSATVSVAQYGSTNTTTNLNTATFTIVPFNVTDSITDTTNYSLSGGRVTVTDAGKYLVSAIVNATGAMQRGRVGIEIFIDATSTGYRGSDMYLRSSGSLTVGSSSVTALLDLSAGQIVDIRSITQGNTGSITMISGDSVFSITQIAGSTAATGVSSATNSTADPSSIDLSNVAGTYYTDANNTTQYTVSAGAVTGGFAHICINAASEPSFTNATKMMGATFSANTDMKLIVYRDGTANYFFFLEI